ncbi:MAG: hypothetical protein ACI83W_000606 [Marinoscillum sp.]|jgi:hypothetical protein
MNLTLRKSLQTLSICSLVLLLVSCGGNPNKDRKEAEQAAFEQAEKKISTDLDRVLGELPSPTEVPYLLQATGADFDANLINSLDKLSRYETSEDEAGLNLGVYATDMGYLLSYGKVTESTDYMGACQKLAEALGIASVFDMKTIEAFQSNMNNPDSLNQVISRAIIDVESRLEDADRVSVAALILTGSFIEGLYLAVKVIETYPTDILDVDTRNLILEPMVKVVLDQRKPLLDVISMLKDLPQDDIIAKMITELNILKIFYDGDLADIQEKISQNTGGFVLTQDMLIDITTEVKRVRNDIIEL